MAKTYDLGEVTAYAIAKKHGYTGTEEQFAAEMTGAATQARAAAQDAEDAEAYATGQRNGTDVPSTDPAYHNNAKYWANTASGANVANAFDTATAYSVGDYVLYNGTMYRFTTAHPAGAWDASHVTAVKAMDEVADLKEGLNGLESSLVNEGIIIKGYSSQTVFDNCTITDSGKIGNGSAGKNAYTFSINPGTTVEVNGGNVYGLFGELPVKNATVTVDGTRHVGALSNTHITMPSNANYLVVVNSAEPSVKMSGTGISERMTEFETLIGNSSMGTTEPTITGAIAEHQEEIGIIDSDVNSLKSRVESITTASEPVNYANISSETFIVATSDTTATYNEGNVTLQFTQVSNPVVLYDLPGLTANKSYALSFDLISGGMSSAGNQKVGIYTSGNSLHKLISAATLTNNTYTIEFTAESGRMALQLGLANAYKLVTLGNFKLVDADYVQKTVIKPDALSNISVDALDDELQELLTSMDDEKRFLRSDTNLLKDIEFTQNHYINGGVDGVSTPTGSPMSSSGYIPVEKNETYYWHNILYGYWAFYSSESEDSYLEGIGYQDERNSGLFHVPPTANYVRVTCRDSNISTAWISSVNKQPSDKIINVFNDTMLAYRDYPTNPCDYNGNEFSMFNKCLCIGDSLTQGVCNYTENGTPVTNVSFQKYSYPTQLKKITGVDTTNMGAAGLTTAQWYSAKSSVDFSGHDVAIIQLGVNDAIFNHGWSSEEATALTNILTKLKTENSGIKIFVATIIPALSYTGEYYDSVSSGIRNFIEEYDDMDVVLVDLAKYGHTGDYEAYNNGHLTAYGYKRLAEDYKAYISYIMLTNMNAYRWVQFIGTDHKA